ncbi:hypothetical protein [Mariniradius sediminis]|uniref:Uncharacterized protein n=1 Tax=Mariniradius sediminis TaxID=2909237 RepID=A0ABS9BVE6_9BACT|nr:hypothetical protein [Mariniradius sediminis]MCF1751146.1 hypothetical protein [Mariniradius sediminis]
MKTFSKVTLLIWALTVCVEGEKAKPASQPANGPLILAQKTTHSCDAQITSSGKGMT